MGYFITSYAKIESGLRFFIAHALNVPVHIASVVCAPYGGRDFINVAKSLAKLQFLSNDDKEEFTQLLGRFKEHKALRNAIAHHIWTDSKRPGAVRPMYSTVWNERAEFYGHDDEEPDYTAEDIVSACQKLDKLHSDLVDFYNSRGVTEHIMGKSE